MNPDDIKSIQQHADEQMKKAIDHLEVELVKIRAGKANPQMVDGITVDYYGSSMQLNQVSNVSVMDARTLSIQPWEKNMLQPIEKAIIAANIGIHPQNDGNIIRLFLPPLTEERRKDMAKIIGKKMEESRISVRQERDGVWKQIQENERIGEISENEKFASKEKLEKLVSEVNGKIAEMAAKKEKEIMEI